MTTDDKLIQQSLRGDTSAFGALVERYKQLVCALAYSATGNPVVSEEIAQETFVVAWRNLSRLESPGKLRPWLAAIVRNIAGDWFRRRSRDQRRMAAFEQSASAGRPQTPREAAIAHERQDIVWQAIEGMPETYRVTLVLYYREGMSVQKVAETLQLSPDAVKQRLVRGRAMMRDHLAGVVEDTLRRTAPGAGFTVGVLRVLSPQAALPAQSVPQGVFGLWASSSTLAAVGGGVAVVVVLGLLAMFLPYSAPSRSARAAAATPPVPAPASVLPPAAPDEPVAPTPLVSVPAQAEPAAQALPAICVVPSGYPGMDPEQAPCEVVTGTVYDSRGQSARDAKVWAARFGFGMRDTREVRTDEAGRFELRVPRGVWKLRARRDEEGGVAPFQPGGIFNAPGRGDVLRTDIRMKRQGIVRGQVNETETGHPIPGVRLWTDEEFTVEADEQGRYAIEGVGPGAHCLFAITPGRERRYVQFCTAFRPQCELDISLAPAGKARGRVVTEDGHPVAFAWLERPTSLWGAGNGVVELCDEQGRFDFEGLPFGQEVTLKARIPAYYGVCGDPYPQWQREGVCDSRTCRIRPGDAPPELIFVLRAVPVREEMAPREAPVPTLSGAVCGKVVGDNGQPVRSFRVLLQWPDSADIAPGQSPSLEINSWDKGFSFTAADGSFALATRDLAPGKYVRLVVTADGYGEAVHDAVLIHPIDRAAGFSPLLFRLPAQRRLAVRVLDDSDRPLADAEVRLLDPMFQQQHREWLNGQLKGARASDADTDAEGVARFEGLAMTLGDVTVHREGYAVARVAWRGEPNLDIVLQRPCVVEGILFDPQRQPLQEGYVSLKRTEAQMWNYFSPEDDAFQREVTPEDGGRIRIGDLPAGRYTLTADAKPVLMQVGIDFNGAPVTAMPLDSRIFYQEFTLEPGQTYRFTCPDDSAHLNTSEWLSTDVSADDLKLRSALLGTWVSTNRTPGGRPICNIEHFASDGCYRQRNLAANVFPFPHAGHFKVSGGILRRLSDTVGMASSECTLSSDDNTLTLRPVGAADTYTYRRAQSLDAAIAEGEALVGPPPPLPYTPIDPVPFADAQTRGGSFGSADAS